MFSFFEINVKFDVEKIQQVNEKYLILVLTFGIFSEIERYSTEKEILSSISNLHKQTCNWKYVDQLFLELCFYELYVFEFIQNKAP